jgi:serine/threonine protein kinase/Tol biopolymer transport system component
VPLAPGTRLGPYEISAQIGAGGMGEVYRAADTNLKRAVAIKVLPDALAADAERLARLQREAEVLASLNHPHIAQIYGLERSDGSTALILELVEGPTLADRIIEGAIPIEDALPIARQIAAALEAAHEQGIVHRDLKPANIKVRPDGQVKVLDFGLAKLATGDLAPASAGALTASPTLSLPATYLGVILGTAGYMSPEQAKGKAVDRRADIWAFGVVLCEMLTGRRMYDGETVAETLARIIEREPDPTALPASTPEPVRHIIERCLTKDPRARLQAIGEARIAIERAIAQPRAISASGSHREQEARRWSGVVAWTLATASTIALLVTLGLWAPWKSESPPAAVRMTADIGVEASLVTDVGTAAVLSPNGQLLTFVAQKTAREPSQLYVRRLDQLTATLLPGTDDARGPFFSPDGAWIAFFAGGKLKKVATAGGAIVTLSEAPAGRGGSWAEDGMITFQPDISSANASLARVSSAGGKPEILPREESGRARFPQALPGNRGLLYTRDFPTGTPELLVALPSGERRMLMKGAYGRYLPSGHLVYMQDATLFAVVFDLQRLEPIGQSVPVIEGVMTEGSVAAAQFAVSETGTLVYLPGHSAPGDPPISWVDRAGVTTTLTTNARNWSYPRFSPDGNRLAIDILDGSATDVWTYDLGRGSLDRLTFGTNNAGGEPVWTPDSQRVTFRQSPTPGGISNLYWRRVDLKGDMQRLTESDANQFPGSWHPSGKYFAFVEQSQQTNPDIWVLPMEGDEASGWKPGNPTALLNTPAIEQDPAFSPDGRWLAFASNQTGSAEVYVRPFPGPGGPWQISSGGGYSPVWSRTKSELYFATPTQHIMVTSYRDQGGSFQKEQPRRWSDVRFLLRGRRGFIDLHPDGNRFALGVVPQTLEAARQDRVVFVFNFFDELRRLVPEPRR